VLRRAAALGLTELAITDHDCLDVHLEEELGALSRELGLVLRTGTELDVLLDGEDAEILGYDFDPQHPALKARVAGVQAQRWERYHHDRDALARAGEPIGADGALAPHTRVPIKVHIFRALHAAGREFEGGYKGFARHLDALNPPPMDKPTLDEAVQLIVDAGGYALIAHPLYFADDIGLDRLLAAGSAAGCAGVERYYPYDYGWKAMPLPQVLAGLEELDRLIAVHFPEDPVLSRGSDVHIVGEWAARLALLRQWEQHR
jgi:predicted metal-dependent phosphoesterase TrpH